MVKTKKVRKPSQGSTTIIRSQRVSTNGREKSRLNTALLRKGTKLNAGDILKMQQVLGNQRVNRLIQEKQNGGVLAPVEHIHQEGAHSNPRIARQEGATDPNLDRLEGLRNLMGNTMALHGKAYQTEIDAIKPLLSTKLAAMSKHFERAYGIQSTILKQARLDAENENVVRGIIAGAVCSLVIAAAAEFVAIAAGLKITLGSWWALQSGAALTSSGLGTKAAGLIMAPTAFHSVIPKDYGQLRQLQQLLYFEKTVSSVHRGMSNLGQRYRHLSLVIDEMKAGRSGIVQEDIKLFISQEKQLTQLPGNYYKAWLRARAVKEKLEKLTIPPIKTIEKALWVNWIASLELKDHDLLDRDAVEDYLHGDIKILGKDGLLGVDTRAVFDTKLEKKAILKAKAMQPDLFKLLSVPKPP